MRNILLLLILINLAGCESSEDVVISSKCIKINLEMVDAINSGFSTDVYKIKADTAMAIKSNDFKKVYFIAALVDGMNSEEVAIWTSNSLQAGEGMIMSINEVAIKSSLWPDGKKTKANILLSDHGVSESEECVLRLVRRSDKR